MYPLAGWLVDRFGAGRIMLMGIVGWSLSCMAAGVTRGFGAFAFFRGMLGLAEPLAYPAQLRVVTAWFPEKLRGTANSLCVAGGTVGAIIAVPSVAWLSLRFGWRSAFLLPALLGLLIAGLWRAFYCEPMRSSLGGAVGSEKGAERFTWSELWGKRSLWGILLCRFISDPVWYFCLFWLPGYLQEHSGLTLKQIGMAGWIPFLAADLGAIGAAAWSDWLVRKGGEPMRARKTMLTCAALVTPVCALAPHLPGPVSTLAVFSLVAAAALSWLFSLSVVITESFPAANVGSVLGIAGGFGATGAILFNIYVGRVIGSVGADKMFLIMAVLYPIAAVLLWTMVRNERKVAM
jgi:ACS family hexuronate transporter-like MFS transporter